MRKPFLAQELDLIKRLEIPINLTRQTPGKTLHDFWARYQAGLAAINKSTTLQKKPTNKTITDIFIGSSQWFNWNKVFIKVKTHGDMVKWLNEADDAPSAVDVWKVEQDEYTLENLKAWLNNGGKLVIDKGKAKAEGSEEKKKKKKKDAQL